MRTTHRRRPAAISAMLLGLALVAGCTTSEASPKPGDGPQIAVVPGKTPSPAAEPDHGDPPERIAPKIEGMRALRDATGRGPLGFGVAGYVVCRGTEAAAPRGGER